MDTQRKRSIRTLAKLKDLWEDNIKANRPYIKHDISELWNESQIIDGSLISAGPSLKNNIKEIKTRNKEICCVDMAAKYCVDNGIIPKYIVCSEAKPDGAKIFNYNYDIPLLCDVVTNPEIIKMWKGKKYFYVILVVVKM